jgi:hypothetical protein
MCPLLCAPTQGAYRGEIVIPTRYPDVPTFPCDPSEFDPREIPHMARENAMPRNDASSEHGNKNSDPIVSRLREIAVNL